MVHPNHFTCACHRVRFTHRTNEFSRNQFRLGVKGHCERHHTFWRGIGVKVSALRYFYLTNKMLQNSHGQLLTFQKHFRLSFGGICIQSYRVANILTERLAV